MGCFGKMRFAKRLLVGVGLATACGVGIALVFIPSLMIKRLSGTSFVDEPPTIEEVDRTIFAQQVLGIIAAIISAVVAYSSRGQRSMRIVHVFKNETTGADIPLNTLKRIL